MINNFIKIAGFLNRYNNFRLRAVVRLKAQHSDNEIKSRLFVSEGYDPNQITSSNFSFLIGVIQNQTGRQYEL